MKYLLLILIILLSGCSQFRDDKELRISTREVVLSAYDLGYSCGRLGVNRRQELIDILNNDTKNF
ncbi:MAG: hypothetical protein PHY56_00785 [Candidatus Omnitrophica bacterium]|nr:hypothetical protein [Candidatus Omnitrophota bacterium]